MGGEGGGVEDVVEGREEKSMASPPSTFCSPAPFLMEAALCEV